MKNALSCLSLLTLLFRGSPCSAQLSERQEKNLVAFTKLYGYVRYFHPSDEAAGLAWDPFAIYGSRQVLTAKDDAALIKTLQELFRPIAPTLLIYTTKQEVPLTIPNLVPPDTTGYNVIAWEHRGWGGGTNKAYESVRLNRRAPLRNNTGAAFAPISLPLDPDPLKGKKFRLTGWMKVNSEQDGTGHFWLRVDKQQGTGFFYNMADKPATENTWKEYAFTGTIDTNAVRVTMGVFLSGRGQVLADHLRLQVEENGGWKEVAIENAGFENWTEGKGPEKWLYNATLAGYRYAPEKNDVQEGKQALLIASVDPEQPMARVLFPGYPFPGETLRTTLTPGIACSLPLALYGNADHTYPAGDAAALQQLQQHIKPARNAPYTADSLSVRLADIVISWNIFRHFFVYWEDASVKPDQLLQQALEGAGRDRTTQEFLRTMRLMTAALNDGHISVNFQGDTGVAAAAPLTLAFVEGQVVIDKIMDSTLSRLLTPGDRITTIGGKPVAAVFSDARQLVSGSPQWKEYRALQNMVRGPRNSTLTLTVLRKEGPVTINVPRSFDPSQYYSHLARTTPGGWIRPGIFYIDLDRFPMDSIRKWMPQLATAKAIICDLRGYPKANHMLISNLLKEKENSKWMFLPEITRPDLIQVRYDSSGWNMTPAEPHLDARIFFLTDGRAISYAESYMGFIKDFKLATIVGQPTAGTNGDVNPFNLPGGFYVAWTGLLVRNHDGSKHHLKGIVPDVPVNRTIKGIQEGKDEFLDKALELASVEK